MLHILRRNCVNQHMKPNHIPLTQAEFDLICQPSKWRIDEIPFKTLYSDPKAG